MLDYDIYAYDNEYHKELLYTANDKEFIWITSPRPRNSVAISEDKNLELLPVTYTSALGIPT